MRSKSLLALAIAVFALEIPGLPILHGSGPTSSGGNDHHAVLLELFTSEGCSSCPPADAFLKALDDAGHLDGVEIIAIEEHVDYWNRLGWTDPFSSRDWSERQERYARSFRHDGVYTPQLVINGRSEVVGSSAREARPQIMQASKSPTAELHLSLASRSSQSVEVTISVENIPPEAHAAELWLAVTERGLASNVLRGENEGRNLSHAAVLRSLAHVRAQHVDAGSAKATNHVALDRSWKRENLRFVVFLQEPKTLHIFGAAADSISH
jgi:hypothetical protein